MILLIKIKGGETTHIAPYFRSWLIHFVRTIV